eukprot:4859532-Alexandrium_andersonii.AAC.1
MVPPPEPEEEVQQPEPALADVVPDTRLAAPAEPRAAASSAAAPAPQDVLQDFSREFVEAINPASGDGLPTVQTAVSGS